jgi:hypothetical protein
MALPDLLDPSLDVGLLPFGRRDQIEQRVRDAAAGGQHDAKARVRILFQDLRHALHTSGVGDARAAEFMYSPTLHGAYASLRLS